MTISFDSPLSHQDGERSADAEGVSHDICTLACQRRKICGSRGKASLGCIMAFRDTLVMLKQHSLLLQKSQPGTTDE